MGRPEEGIYRFLDTNGDGTGTKNANGDYSVTPQEFYFLAPRPIDIHRMILHIEDTSGMQAQDYGNITGGLTNGYRIVCKDADENEIADYTDGLVIQTNAQIGRICYDVDLKTWGAGNEALQARFTTAKAGSPVRLRTNMRISITYNDDLTGLIEHYVMLQGYESG